MDEPHHPEHCFHLVRTRFTEQGKQGEEDGEEREREGKWNRTRERTREGGGREAAGQLDSQEEERFHEVPY